MCKMLLMKICEREPWERLRAGFSRRASGANCRARISSPAGLSAGFFP